MLLVWVCVSVLQSVWLNAPCAAEIMDQTKPGGTVALTCSISDSTNTLSWFHGGKLIHSINPKNGLPLRGKAEMVKRSRLKHETTLEISGVTRGDAGLFTCKVGRQEEQHRLIVASASVAPPVPLVVGGGAVLRCDVDGLADGWTVQWRGPGGRSHEAATVHLSPVTEQDGGTWECAITPSGKTITDVKIQVRDPLPPTSPPPPTTRMTVGNKEACPHCVNGTQTAQTPPLLPMELSWWVWAAIGGGCVVVLLWVLALIMYNRLSRRKRRFMKMKEAALLRPKNYCQCPGPRVTTGPGRTKPSAPAPPPARPEP
ncbi:T-cell surface glycoprotein CD4-like [Periophthalmus magnuspinnatus]|uniref:T-cell surface glycoprotein CD4-like n=1 Tax=Periophthalmus magnuspinnatus TaxID=409849 RepID=UPI00145A7926|nr:T-cell surface glycoprotein CD4-like [Periophthalmus magnuspinnatus]